MKPLLISILTIHIACGVIYYLGIHYLLSTLSLLSLLCNYVLHFSVWKNISVVNSLRIRKFLSIMMSSLFQFMFLSKWWAAWYEISLWVHLCFFESNIEEDKRSEMITYLFCPTEAAQSQSTASNNCSDTIGS